MVEGMPVDRNSASAANVESHILSYAFRKIVIKGSQRRWFACWNKETATALLQCSCRVDAGPAEDDTAENKNNYAAMKKWASDVAR